MSVEEVVNLTPDDLVDLTREELEEASPSSIGGASATLANLRSAVRLSERGAAHGIRAQHVLGMALVDAACLLLLTQALRPTREVVWSADQPAHAVIPISVAIWWGVFAIFGLYGRRAVDARQIVAATSSAYALLLVVMWGPSSETLPLALLGVLALIGVAEVVARIVFHRAVVAPSLANSPLSTVVVGSGDETLSLLELLAEPESGHRPVAAVRTDQQERSDGGSVAWSGSLADLAATLRGTGASCLYVASTETSTAQMDVISRAARIARCRIHLTAPLPSMVSSRLSFEGLELRHGGRRRTAIVVDPVPRGRIHLLSKRAFDIAGSVLLLMVTSPLMLATAIAVKASSRGPVLFRQERVTRGGRVFRMLKFRTMRSNADAYLEAQGIDPTRPFFKLDHDPRLTRVGRVIRRLSIDELPQLVNVLCGSMSLVGPRPLPVEQVRANLQLLNDRHEVKPGLTGWWQINGRSAVSAEEALQNDSFYVENWSLSLDLYILARTARAVLSGRGAQ
jgi:exopolysaccharide biosynthesis polyprenyl glycosylphosphotransferase